MLRLQTAGVIGGGAWGTALAQSLTMAGRDALLWARDADAVEAINKRHVNERRLPGVALAANLRATSDLSAAAAQDLVLIAVPAQQMRATAAALRPHVSDAAQIVICAKGYENGTNSTMSDIIVAELGARPSVLSGPSFAADVARGLPTAVTLGVSDAKFAAALASAIGHRNFRIYVTDDLAGVQMGGAVKNVLAIAAGIVAGRRLGASAQAALVTRAFDELFEFGRHLGVHRETLTGLSCLGDLILTCNSPQSRNFTFGRHLGEGATIAQAQASTGGTVEGIATAAGVHALARLGQGAVDMPIAGAVHAIVNSGLSVDAAIDALLSRPQKSAL